LGKSEIIREVAKETGRGERTLYRHWEEALALNEREDERQRERERREAEPERVLVREAVSGVTIEGIQILEGEVLPATVRMVTALMRRIEEETSRKLTVLDVPSLQTFATFYDMFLITRAEVRKDGNYDELKNGRIAHPGHALMRQCYRGCADIMKHYGLTMLSREKTKAYGGNDEDAGGMFGGIEGKNYDEDE
jgi:hypothetical protein